MTELNMHHTALSADLLDYAYTHTAEAPTSTGISSTMRLATPLGWKNAAQLAVGEEVMTFDHGFQPIKSIKIKRHSVYNDAIPLIVTAGAVGNNREFLVPEHQAVLMESDKAEQLLGNPFALVRASDLLGYKGITRIVPSDEFHVVSLEFENDQVVVGANGGLLFCPTEARPMDASPRDRLQAPEYTIVSSVIAATLIMAETSAQKAWKMQREEIRDDWNDVLYSGPGPSHAVMHNQMAMQAA